MRIVTKSSHEDSASDVPADPVRFTQIEARGPDAVSFLQAQLTQDLRRVSASHSPLAAWCDPLGRVRVVMRLLALDDGIGLVLPCAMADETLVQLAKYRLRARLELRRSPDSWRAFAVHEEHARNALEAAALLPARQRDASRSHGGVTAVRLAGNAHTIECYGDAAALEAAGLARDHAMDAAQWARARIAAGIADLDASCSGRFTPHMLNLDRLGAVNFDKGCYSGQEIIARTQHRGTAKRRLQRCRADYDALVGERLHAHGEEVGEVVAAAGNELLALLPVDAGGEPLAGRAGQVRVLTQTDHAPA